VIRIPADGPGQEGPAQQLLRLQNDFHARLAEETLRYLRGLQTALGPASPGTVLTPEPGRTLQARGRPGGTVEVRLEVRNEQAAHCVVTPAPSPLVASTGVTWFPQAELRPPYLLVAPDDAQELVVTLQVPEDLAPGLYRGALVLHGAPSGVPLVVRVEADPGAQEAARETSAARQVTTRKAATKKAATKKAATKKAATKKAATKKPTTKAATTRTTTTRGARTRRRPT
jgi:hypothetical protein